MPPPKLPEDAKRQLAAAQARYVPDARKPTMRDIHTGRAGVVQGLFDEIATMRARNYLWRHIVQVLREAQLAEPGLTDKQLSVAFNHEARRRQGRLRRKGKLVTSSLRPPAPQPGPLFLRPLVLAAAETAGGAVWEAALVDETGQVLQRHPIFPDDDNNQAYSDAIATGTPLADLGNAQTDTEVAEALADAVATLALDMPVRLVINATRWTTVTFAEALSRRCAGPPRQFGAGIEITVVDETRTAEPQSAVQIATQLSAEALSKVSP